MNKKTLSLLAFTPLLLASCGGGKTSTSSAVSSSSAISSIDSATGFAALKTGLKAFVNRDNFGFDYARPTHTTKSDNDFTLTYTPMENDTTTSSSVAASSASSSVATSSDVVDPKKPFTLGVSFFASDKDYPMNFYLNGAKDVVGDDVLAYTNLDYTTLRFAQGDKKPTNYSETGLTLYASMSSLFMDFSQLSSTTISAINSAVRSIKGNENWTFPEDQRAQVKIPDKVNSAITYFLPLTDYLPVLVDDVTKDLEEDYSATNSFGQSFAPDGDSILFKINITSFKSLYTLLVTSVKAVINSKGDEKTQFAEWTLINDSVLKPIKKYGDCLDTFNISSTLTYTAKGLDKIDFSLDLKANLDSLKTAYASDNPSGFVTVLNGGGTLKAVIDKAATIPTPTPALSTYPELPAITLTSGDQTA